MYNRLSKENLLKYFDWEFYLNKYPDLAEVYTTQEEAIGHYVEHGYEEGRICSDKVSYSLVTVCKNRVENLIQTLPSWLNAHDNIKEYVIVDYDSDEPISENKEIKVLLSKHSNIKIIRVENESQFNLGKAFNIGIDHATHLYIIKVDSDYLCKNGGFLKYFNHTTLYNIFIRSDYHFCIENDEECKSLNGFCMFPNIPKARYREDLNGWGFDDIDFYDKLSKDLDLFPVYFFNITDYIQHIPHESKKDGVTNKQNKALCNLTQRSIRQPYTNNHNVVHFNYIENPIDKIFCINVDDRKDRWERFKRVRFGKNNLEVTRISATIAESPTSEIAYQPCNLDTIVYMSFCPKAFGTFLSHYSIWENIVNNNINRAIIIEDDIMIDSLYQFFDSSYIFSQNIHYTNLSKRIREEKGRPYMKIFDGGESYILDNKGAQILLSAVDNPTVFSNLELPNYNGNVNNIPDKTIVNKDFTLTNKKSIIAPVDKFMGFCCSSDKVLLSNCYMYPIISLDSDLANQSDLTDYDNPCWEMTGEELGKLDIFK